MTLIVVPQKKNNIDKYYRKKINTFILGLKDFSVNYKCKFSVKDIIKIKNKYSDVNIFISIDKMIDNCELETLKEILKEIDKIKIKGILFYDNSILQLKEELKLSTELVWNNLFCVVNYNACNYYYDNGCKYALISSEITTNEIVEIKKKTSMKLMVNVFGYLTMSYSKRRLLTNYFKDIKRIKFKNNYVITEKSSNIEMLIKEEKAGTIVYRHELLDASKAIFKLLENDIDYFILVEDYIPYSLFNKVLDKYLLIKDNYKFIEKGEEEKELSDIIKSGYTGFFQKKTIYKVKK
ncbi:MAG: U32 family peptidase [Bacilli bacterium]